MEIKPGEIGSILKERIQGMDTGSADLSEVGTVLEIEGTASPASTGSTTAWRSRCSSCPTTSSASP